MIDRRTFIAEWVAGVRASAWHLDDGTEICPIITPLDDGVRIEPFKWEAVECHCHEGNCKGWRMEPSYERTEGV